MSILYSSGKKGRTCLGESYVTLSSRQAETQRELYISLQLSLYIHLFVLCDRY